MEKKYTLGEIEQGAYNFYQHTYKSWSDYDKLTKTNCLNDESRFTFATDMVVYLMDSETAPQEIDKYIKRALKNFCKHHKQAYYELILSTMAMSNLFYELGYKECSKVCSDWYLKLFYDEEFLLKYVTEEEISDLWGLR